MIKLKRNKIFTKKDTKIINQKKRGKDRSWKIKNKKDLPVIWGGGERKKKEKKKFTGKK